jgi:peptide/nickel transport system substrate-binding protein
LYLFFAPLAWACRGEPPAPATPQALQIGVSLPTQSRNDVGVAALIDGLTGDSLLTLGPDGSVEPRIAESWQWSDDRLVLTLNLRSDVKLHDGSPLTAEFAKRVLTEYYASKTVPGYDSIDRVEAPSARTVAIHLKRPNAFALTDLNTYPMIDPKNKAKGSGPFALKVRGEVPELHAFDAYYRGRPSIDVVRVKSYQTQRQAWASLMRGDINMLHEVSRDAVDFVQAESTVETYSFLRPYYIALTFNMRHPALRSPQVRRALSDAVDRPTIVKLGMGGHGIVADGPIWPQHWAYNTATRSYAYAPELAKMRLDEAGFREHAASAGEMPNRFKFQCLYYAEDPRFERIALLLQRQLFEVGVDLEFEPVSMRQFAGRVHEGNFDAFLFEMTSGRSLSWVYHFWHSPNPGAMFFVNSGYRSADAALDTLRATVDQAEIRAITSDLQRIFFEDPPAIFIAWPEASRAVSNIFDVPQEPGRDIMGSIWHWAPAAPLRASR